MEGGWAAPAAWSRRSVLWLNRRAPWLRRYGPRASRRARRERLAFVHQASADSLQGCKADIWNVRLAGSHASGAPATAPSWWSYRTPHFVSGKAYAIRASPGGVIMK